MKAHMDGLLDLSDLQLQPIHQVGLCGFGIYIFDGFRSFSNSGDIFGQFQIPIAANANVFAIRSLSKAAPYMSIRSGVLSRNIYVMNLEHN